MWNKGNSNFLTKKSDLEKIIEVHKPLLFGVLEANMGENCYQPALNIDGYSLERDNLASEGGITRAAVYVIEGLNYSRRKDLEVKASPMIWLEINPNSKEAWLAFIGYREWRSLLSKKKKKSRSMPQQLLRLGLWREKWLEAEKEQKPMFLMGDWNVDTIPWTTPSLPLTPYQSSKASLLTLLREMASENNLDLIYTKPTRKQGKNPASTLDLVMTNRPNLIQQVSLLPSSSDHLVLMIEKVNKIKPKIPGPQKIRSFKLYTKEKMIHNINVPMLNSLLDYSDTNFVANVFISHITEAINLVAPIKTIQPRAHYAPYLSAKTKEEMNTRNELRSKANVSGEEADMKEYKKCKNLTLKHQRRDKVAWAKELIGTDTDGKKTWKTVQKICKSKSNNKIDKLIIDGKVIEDKGQMADGLNNFFISKVEKLTKITPQQTTGLAEKLRVKSPDNVPQLELKELTMIQLEELMKGVKKTPAAGIDEISGHILLDIFDQIKLCLLHLINLSLCTGIYPEIFKLTKIIPVEKSGKDPLLASSYRPVCNLSVIGKLVERACMNQIANHISQHQLMNKDQHGGRSQHSTTTCLGEILEDAKKALEDKKLVAIVAIDLSAAYDLVDHEILYERCRLMLNLDPGTLSWLRSFLGNRSQLVELSIVRSRIRATGTQGVVQGGPSSGLLFNIYINTLPAQVNHQTLATTTNHSTCKQYIDDGSIIARGRNINELKRNIESDYEGMRLYLEEHKMVINPEKTQLMQLLPYKETDQLQINLNGVTITNQKSIKILGLTITEDLKFDEFIWKGKNSLIRRVQYRTSMVRTLKTFLPKKILYQVGNSLINSTIQYGAALWGATSLTNIAKVQSAQIRAGRIISGNWRKKRDGVHRQDLMNLMKWQNVNQLINTATLNLTKNAISSNSSVGMNSLFRVTKPSSERRNKGLRVDHRGPRNRSNMHFSANAAITYNKLPLYLREISLTTKQFKIKLKKHIKTTNLLAHH